MGNSDFQGRINAWLRETGDRVCGSGGSAIRVHRLYVEDIGRRLGKLHRNSKVKLAVGVYVEDQDPGGDRVVQLKKRGGLFVVAGSDLLLARDLSWGRTKYEGFDLPDFTAEPITFQTKGKNATPGVRLRSLEGGLSFALGLWYIGGEPHPKGTQMVCDRMVELVNESVAV